MYTNDKEAQNRSDELKVIDEGLGYHFFFDLFEQSWTLATTLSN